MPGLNLLGEGASALNVQTQIVGLVAQNLGTNDVASWDQDAITAQQVQLDPTRTDTTWAFNQATGARLDSTLALDREPNELDFHINGTIHPGYPSLNRLPGTIYVPPGRYYIYGTITLFAGQRLVGASSLRGAPDLPGSVLVKVGAGPCIRVLPPHDLDAFLEMSDEDFLELFAEGTTPDVRPPPALQLQGLGLVQGAVAQVVNGQPSERRKATIAQFAKGAGPAFVSHLRIEYEPLPDDPARVAAANLVAPRAPTEDAFSTVGVGDFFLTEQPLNEPRLVPYRRYPHLTTYDSGGLELANPVYSHIEDVVIEGFTEGFGVLTYSNHFTADALSNTLDRVRVRRCHRGIVLARTTVSRPVDEQDLTDGVPP